MYISKINIKHNRSNEIHWGMHKLTNKFIWIDDVEANGFACNCKCACCGSDLKACTQGQIQQHHFKHRGNNGCYYSDEIAEYLKVAELLSSFATIWIPPVLVRIGNHTETITAEELVSIRDVSCIHDANHYPPLLTATINQKTTRIILSFSDYYSDDDYKQFINEAKTYQWNCLEILLPHKNEDLQISTDALFSYAFGAEKNKRWIFNTTAHLNFTRLKQAAKTIPPKSCNYGGIIDIDYPCPLHKKEHHGYFYALKQDCQDCEFRLDFISDKCRCMAETGISSIADFEIPEENRKQSFFMLRQKNEAAIYNKRSEAEQRRKYTPQGSAVANTGIVPDDKRNAECFAQKICPICSEPLFKKNGKLKINWMCLHGEFFAIEDIDTGEVIFQLNNT